MSLILQDIIENKIMSNETEFEQDFSSYISSKKYLSPNDSMVTSQSYTFKPFKCSCYEYLESTKVTHNKILALIWALSSVLKYNPTDPIYYISYQLLRWKYNNVPEKYVKEVIDYMDSQL